MFGSLLARTIDRTLKAHLPTNASANPNPGGLNLDMIRSFGHRYLSKSGNLPSKGNKLLGRNLYSWSIIIATTTREADPSKQDAMKVKVICVRCRNPLAEKIDTKLRYEISTGRYVRMRKSCRECSGFYYFGPTLRSLSSVSMDCVYKKVRDRIIRNEGKQGNLSAQAWVQNNRWTSKKWVHEKLIKAKAGDSIHELGPKARLRGKENEY